MLVWMIPKTSSEAELRFLLAARFAVSEFIIVGEGECVGLPGLRTGNTIDLQGLGNRYSSNDKNYYFTIQAVHTFDENGFKTAFQVIRPSVGPISVAPNPTSVAADTGELFPSETPVLVVSGEEDTYLDDDLGTNIPADEANRILNGEY